MRRASFLPTVLVLAVAFVLVPATWAVTKYKYKILHAFTGGADGGAPASSLALDGASSLYGTTYSGGKGADCPYQGGCGVVFELSPGANGRWKESVLLNFVTSTGGAIGGGPTPPPLLDGAGDVFGSTDALEPGSPAYVFELTPGGEGWNFNPIYNPAGNCLVLDQTDDLYGCIPPGVFGELSPGSKGWAYTDLYNGDGCNSPCYEGDYPVAPLSWDAHGNLYGTMLFGGNNGSNCPGSAGCGVAFQMTPNGDGTWTYHVLHRFASSKTDGYYPYAGLTVDASGTAYGVTSAGGKYGTGTFFKLTPTTGGHWKETILYEFPNCHDGCGPGATLVPDEAGNLYSSGAGGLDCGGISCGTVFKFTPQTNGTWKYSVLHKFNGTDGAFPYGVILDDKGNIFGTTMQGGKYNLGVAFEITP